MDKINQRIAEELGVAPGQVAAAVELLGEGSTVPFIARYRKEKTGGLDDTQLRKLEERLGYLRELEDRRALVLKRIDEQGKLTPELARSINGAATKVELEDLYAPVQAEAAHQGADRARSGARAAERRAAQEPVARSRDGSREVHRCRQRRRRRQGRAGRRAPHPHRAHRRDARAGWRPARMAVDRGRPEIRRAQGQERGRREVLRLFRLRPAHQGHAVASRARHAARHERGYPLPRSRRCARGGQAASGRGAHQVAPSASPIVGAPPTRGSARPCASRGRTSWPGRCTPVC